MNLSPVNTLLHTSNKLCFCSIYLPAPLEGIPTGYLMFKEYFKAQFVSTFVSTFHNSNYVLNYVS